MGGFFKSIGGTINDLVDGVGNNIEYRDDARSANLETAQVRNQIAALEAQSRLESKANNDQTIKLVTNVALALIAVVILAYVVKMFK